MDSLRLPSNHPLREGLHDEAHARPSEPLLPPLRLSYLVLFSAPSAHSQQWQQIRALGEQFGVAVPAAASKHLSADFGDFRLVWERHAEFARYTFIVAGLSEHPFATTAIERVPSQWVSTLPGELIVASHVGVLGADTALPSDVSMSEDYFADNPLIGAGVANGAGSAWTDFRIHADGFSRWLIQDVNMTPRQCGRTVQRLLEIDTYRMLAMLALPLANSLTPDFNSYDDELESITQALSTAGVEEERALLERLTGLQARIENRASTSEFRFSAARAYYALVQRRVQDLREVRLPGLQTFRAFVERRLAPAMNTCSAVSRRQASMLERASRATALLSTRVDIAREEQTQAVLESMNRRAKLQLRLQETVEGLSTAAITYYIVGLVGYAAKGLSAAGVAVDPDIAMGVSIPIVVIFVAVGVRRLRLAASRKTS